MRKVLALELAVAMLNPAILGAMPQSAENFQTKTPIKHLVIIFQENVSFDHYFATYPNATNPAGEPAFHAKEGTPSVNGLLSGGGPAPAVAHGCHLAAVRNRTKSVLENQPSPAYLCR